MIDTFNIENAKIRKDEEGKVKRVINRFRKANKAEQRPVFIENTRIVFDGKGQSVTSPFRKTKRTERIKTMSNLRKYR